MKKREEPDAYGFYFNEEGDCLWSDDEQPCQMCGKPTHWIEINYEQHFCSRKCIDDFTCEAFPNLVK